MSMETFVDKLRRDYPSLNFVRGRIAHWSSRRQQITYTVANVPSARWTLLHELGHALLSHDTYASDASLLQKEVEAWGEARQLAQKYSLSISDEHIQLCLDTYREWLHKRSTCPSCNYHGLQQPDGLYACLNCQSRWQVSLERFCRPYRLKKRL